MLSYVVLAEITDTRHVLWGTLIGSALGIGSHLFYGALSDKIGRRRVFLIGALFTIAFGIPMFMLINSGAVVLVITAIALSLLLSHDPIFAVESSWFSEQFPAHIRSSGISLGYNAASVVAGLLPFIATGVYSIVGWIGPAVIFSLLGVISTWCALRTPETAPAKLSEKKKVSASTVNPISS
jgi:MFS family permease